MSSITRKGQQTPPPKSAKTALIQQIMKMSEENAAELAKTITKPSSKTRAKASGAETSTVTSDVNKLVSHSYNLIRGCPEEPFWSGGADPGIITDKQVFKFTFNEGKTDSNSLPLPDQVEYQHYTDMNAEPSQSAYSGGRSFRDAMTSAVSASGTYKASKFTASATVAAVHQEAASTKCIFLDYKQTLALGEVRYLHNEDQVSNYITDEFYAAVMALPVSLTYGGLTVGQKQVYHDFLEEWGTDIIVRAEVGLKYLIRHRANYSAAFLLAKSDGIDTGKVHTGFVTVNLDTVKSLVSTTSVMPGEYEKEVELGSNELPVPTKLYLEPINRALDSKFWVSRFGKAEGNATAAQLYNKLMIQQGNLEWMLEEYADTVGTTLEDHDISIPIQWPRGTYSLPQTTSGCPADFSSGCRTQDNEDTNNQNYFSFNIDWDMQGEFDNDDNDIQTCFCSKTEEGDSIFTWMPGRYCINRKNGTCPEGFSTGYIEWDDENTNNINDRKGELPDGEYPQGSTRIQYCCRDDASSDQDILLPNTQPLVLYPYKDGTCQEVHGMESAQHFVHSDDEDEGNQGMCKNEVPYIPDGCTGPNIKITYCYYQPK